MADVTELRCWPSCVDAIDWSQDGIIALASDERVELLARVHSLKQTCSLTNIAKFPNTVNFERDQDVPQWKHVALKVPLFSTDELPLKEPAPLPIYSIGEEISNSAPIAIAWSSPGLAKHRRCALAALTANLVLSIWSAEGSPQEESSWSRKLIVNHALESYFLKNDTEELNYVASTTEERIRLRARVRAFAWAPPLPCLESTGIVGTRLLYGQHIMAVSNDDNQVVFIIIDSPASTLGIGQAWNAKVLTHLSLLPDSGGFDSELAIFEDIMKKQRHVSHLAWSPWVAQLNNFHSVIVYATNDDVRARVVTYSHHKIELSGEVIYAGLNVRFNGPIRWSPEVADGDLLSLAVFTDSGLVCFIISPHDASIIERKTHNLDGRCDPISGAVWDSAQKSTAHLHVSSLLSSLQNSTAVLESSPRGLVSLQSPSWRDQIENNLVLFSVRNDLKGNGRAKVWGLAISPLRDFVAACNSVHPSDMIEYGPPGDRRGTIAISSLQQYSKLRESFPPWTVTAESVLFTVKKLAENTVETADQMPAFADEVVMKLLQAYTRPQVTTDTIGLSGLSIESSDLEKSIEEFKDVVYLDPHSLKDRYTILVSHACKTAASNQIPITLIAYRLAVFSRTLQPQYSDTLFSAEILSHHQELISLVHRLTTNFVGSESLTSSESNSIPRTDKNKETVFGPRAQCAPDICDFCSAPIPFMDLAIATCTNGHSFPRCGLSFLAIQAPGITKYCGICNTPFLNEGFVAVQDLDHAWKDAEKDAAGAIQDLAGGLAASTPEIDRYPIGIATNRTDQQDHDIENKDQANCDDARDIDVSSRPDNDTVGTISSRKLPVTLARLLFLGCDACIYCGGKFIG